MAALSTVYVCLAAATASAQTDAPQDGAPLSYRHEPAILAANQTSDIVVSVEVLGDIEEVTFRRNVPSLAQGFTTERWGRQTTRTVDGRIISIFGARYEADILADLVVYPHGNDFPQVPLGRLIVPGVEASPPVVWLRLAPSNLPQSTVRSLGAAAQYASHVVNIVVPGFADTRVLGGLETFAVEEAARAFYEHFADAHDTLAFLPVASPFLDHNGLHVNVSNDIQGIGMAQFDRRAEFGSGHLRSVQVYPAGFGAQQQSLLHQLGHQWGDESQLAALAGVDAAGRDPARHTPLVDGGATLLGAVLSGTRAVEFIDGVPQVVRTEGPVRYHPLQRYRMGLVEVSGVPDVKVFADQAQFGDEVSAPSVGSRVSGSWRTVSINDLLAELGPRQGPVFEVWRHAFVVVSDQLVSQREMDFYNFYAQRAAAADGTRSIDGFGSFAEATLGAMALQTRVAPGGEASIDETLEVSNVPFGPEDWRGVVFDEPLPSLLSAGSTITLTGSIDQETLAGSHQFMILRLARHGDPASAARTVQTTISGGRFTLPISLSGATPGAYTLDLFVYDDASGPALPAGSLTPLVVQ